MGSKCVKIALQFEDADFDNQAKILECAKLLKAMELDEEEVKVEEIEDNFVNMNQEEDETCQLPEEWVFNLTRTHRSLSPLFR
jgi:chorismate-pyruvate lyase